MTLQESQSEWLKFFELALQSRIPFFSVKYTEMHSKSPDELVPVAGYEIIDLLISNLMLFWVWEIDWSTH